MKRAPMTRFERRGEDPKEAQQLRREIAKELESMDLRELQRTHWNICKRKG